MTAEELQILERIAAAVEETNQLIRGNMDALRREGEQREKARLRMRRLRDGNPAQGEGALPTYGVSLVVDRAPSPCDVREHDVREHEVGERNEDEKRNIPPTPPIKSKEEEKKDSPLRAREEGDLGVVLDEAESEIEEEKELSAEQRQKRKAARALFDAFWACYPRKVDKKKCRDKYVKILAKDRHFKTNEEMIAFHQHILAGLSRWKTSREWDRGYVCDPYRFLHNERWEEEVVQASAKLKGETEFRRVNPEGPNPMGLRNFIGADDSIKEKIQQIEEAKK